MPSFHTNPWAIAFFILLAFTIGTLTGQLTGTARAQTDVVKVQLDTSNCTPEIARPRPGQGRRWEGAIVAQLLEDSAGQFSLLTRCN